MATEITADGVSQIQNNTVTAADLQDSAVTANKIATGAVGASQIASGAVDSDQIASNAITSAKIASGAVESSMTTQFGRRNLIINGAMQVAQRGSSDSANSNGFGVDRFKGAVTALDNLVTAYTQESPTDLPGFTNSLRVTISTPEGVLESNELLRMMQFIEGQNCQGFKYGTSSAESVTLSFWVKGSITGTYAVSVYCDASSGARMIGSTYTINSANTWEYKTITLVGDTATAIDNDNSEGFRINWILSSGSNYTGTDNTSWANYSGQLAYGHTANTFVTTSGATWEITGVQLEVGTVATPFEHRSYGEELALCQRYFYKLQGSLYGIGFYYTSGDFRLSIDFPVDMRSNPTLTSTGTFRIFSNGGSTYPTSHSLSDTTPQRVFVSFSGISGTAGAGGGVIPSSGDSISLDAEL